MAASAVGTYIVGANAAAMLTAGKIVLDATGEFKGGKLTPRWWQLRQFNNAINQNRVFGFPEDLKLDKYAQTPVITTLGIEEDTSAVSVLPVPPSAGKTTAAYYFMKKNKEQVRGIAFCRRDKSTPYVQSMLKALNLDTDQPPSGWLELLITALKCNPEGDNRRAVLILDEFISTPEPDADSALIETIKLLLTNTRIRVVVLTPSEEYADFLLTRNNLQGIVPYAGAYTITNSKRNWHRMLWPLPTIKAAALHDPRFTEYGPRVDREIDTYIEGLTEELRERVTIRHVTAELEKKLLHPKEPLAQQFVGPDDSASLPDEESPMDLCSQCLIS